MTDPDARAALEDSARRLRDLARWDAEAIEEALRAMLEHLQINGRKGFQPLRVAASGSSISPPLFESLEVLGQDESLRRIEAALDRL
jgi:glutamyl-tRNA synthetase